MVNRAFDKIRQAARGMPAVLIRIIDALAVIVQNTESEAQRMVLLRQAEMVLRVAEASVSESNDLRDIRERFERLRRFATALEGADSVDGT
jgi:uncharacterized membrane protein